MSNELSDTIYNVGQVLSREAKMNELASEAFTELPDFLDFVREMRDDLFDDGRESTAVDYHCFSLFISELQQEKHQLEMDLIMEQLKNRVLEEKLDKITAILEGK